MAEVFGIDGRWDVGISGRDVDRSAGECVREGWQHGDVVPCVVVGEELGYVGPSLWIDAAGAEVNLEICFVGVGEAGGMDGGLFRLGRRHWLCRGSGRGLSYVFRVLG